MSSLMSGSLNLFYVRCHLTVQTSQINLRIFSNVVYFTGRAIAGEDSLNSLTSRAATYAKRVKWVNANKEAIRATIRSKVLSLA